jgi:transposase
VDLIQRELLKGALAHGYSSDLWTLPRVAQVIEAATAVRYHPGHVWRVLRQMGWSLQRRLEAGWKRFSSGRPRPKVKKRQN